MIGESGCIEIKRIFGLQFAQAATDADERAAGSQASDKVRNASGGLIGNFGLSFRNAIASWRDCCIDPDKRICPAILRRGDGPEMRHLFRHRIGQHYVRAIRLQMRLRSALAFCGKTQLDFCNQAQRRSLRR